MIPKVEVWKGLAKFALTGAAIVMAFSAPLLAGDPWGPLDPYGIGFSPGICPAFVDGQIVVKLVDLDQQAIEPINEVYGTQTLQFLPRLGVHLLGLPDAGGGGVDLSELSPNMVEALNGIANRTDVVYAHPNYVLEPLQAVQGSFVFPDQNVAADEYPQQPSVGMLDLEAAHLLATGAGVKVAIIDGGVCDDHPALTGAVTSGYDYVDQDDWAYDESGGANSGHGTFIAGVIHLVAPDAELVSYRVTDLDGSSNGYLVAEAVLQAIEDGCHVINLSLVTTYEHEALAGAIAYAAERNVIVVAAAGNRQPGSFPSLGDPMPYPASDPNVIAVTATDSYGYLLDYANFGAYIDICAPGQAIISTFTEGKYAEWAGTSFAAPFVSGQAALVAEEMVPYVSSEAALELILGTATPLYTQNPDFDGMLGDGMIAPQSSLLEDPLPFLLVFGTNLMIADSGSTEPIDAGMLIWASEDNTTYTPSIQGTPTFLEFPSPPEVSFTTSEWFPYTLNPAGLEPGVYEDTVIVEASGISNSPVYDIVRLWVIHQDEARDSTRVVTFYNPPDAHRWSCVGDVSDAFEESFYIWMDTGTASYSYTVRPYDDDHLDFIHLVVDTGTVDTGYMSGQFTFEIDPSGLEPGVYKDLLEIDVDGPAKTFNPFILFTYTVYSEEECPELADTIKVTPWQNSVLYYHDSLFYDVDSVEIWSTLSSIAYHIEPASYNSQPNDAVLFYGVSGFTNDRIFIGVDTTKFNWWYRSVTWTFYIYGEGTVNSLCSLQFSWRNFNDAPSPPADEIITPVLGNYPNPFNPQTTMHFTLPQSADYSMTVYNILGRQVDRFSGWANAGEEVEIIWDGTGYSSGVYFYRLEAGEYRDTKRMILMK